MWCKYCRSKIAGPICHCALCKANHEQEWDEIIEPRSIYRTTDLSILQKTYPALTAKYREVLNWWPTDRGLMLWGEPRKGKTRVVWMLMRRLFDEGVDICAMRFNDFAGGISEAYGNGMGPEWVRSISSHRVLYIDDLDKMVMTKRVQSELFGVVETITSRGNCLIVTMNSDGQAFDGHFDLHIAGPLIRRIREFSDVRHW